MSGFKVKIAVILLLMIITAGVFTLNIVGLLLGPEYRADEVGSPLVVYEEFGSTSELTQLYSYDKMLYLVYGNDSVIQVYSTEGVFQYGIIVYDHSNGRTEIAVIGDKLYILDKVSNIYIFSNHEFTDYLTRAEAKDLRSNIRFGINSLNYSVKAGSVWYSDGEAEPRCVIKKSGIQALFQSSRLHLILFTLLILDGAVIGFLGQKKVQKNHAQQ